MSIAQSLLPEYDHEMATTRAVLARAPWDRRTWRPHDKSMSVGQLAAHLASLPGWTTATLAHDHLDFNPPGGEPYRTPAFETVAAMLEAFDAQVAAGRAALAAADDAQLLAPWTLRNAGAAIFTMPRVAVLRSFVMNHVIHHRGQFSVYLRLCDVPVPSIYGPTADER